MGASSKDFIKFKDGTTGPSLSQGVDGKWNKNTTGPTPKANAKKIESNAKKIEKIVGMIKKGKGVSNRPSDKMFRVPKTSSDLRKTKV